MAYDPNKLTRLSALKSLAEKVKAECASTTELAALKAAINSKAAKATTLAGYGIADAYTKAQIDGLVSAVYKPAGSAAFASLPAPAAAALGKVYNVTDAFTTDARFVDGAGKRYPAGTNVVVVQVDSAYKYDALSGMVDLSGYAKSAELSKKVDKVDGSRLMTGAEATKLEGIAAGANKYVHPAHTAKAAGLYKVTVDSLGHVTDAAAVTKTDITALGIPAKDTTYSAATGSAAGLMSAADKTKLDGMTIAGDAEITAMLDEVFAAAKA